MNINTSEQKKQEKHPYSGRYVAISIENHIIYGKLTHNEGSDYYIVDDVLFVEERKLLDVKKKTIRQGPKQMVLERAYVTSMVESSKLYHESVRDRIEK